MFWSLTPRQIDRYIRAGVERDRRRQDASMTAAWVNAKLSAYAPDKASNFMKLETLLAPPRISPKRPQTVDEMVNIARQWTAATKGR